MEASKALELAIVLRQFTEDPETLAEFYEAAGMTVAAREARLSRFNARFANGEHKNALAYAEKHCLLSFDEKLAAAREWCAKTIDKRPWEALEVAREYRLVDIAKEAAFSHGESILKSAGMDSEPALDIARRERNDDPDYRIRAARYAFRMHIRTQSFSGIPGLMREFPESFTLEEKELGEFLSESDAKRREERYKKLASA